MLIQKIVSGGQTGVDRAALDVALELGIPCGGWCPRGRRAEDGVIPVKYPVQETVSDEYAERTRLNVQNSDGTLILNTGVLSGGTALTAQIADRNSKPYLLIDLDKPPALDEVVGWINGHHILILNVAGPREEEHPGIHDKAARFLASVMPS